MPMDNQELDNYFGARHAQYAQITTCTKTFSDDGVINCGILHVHAWNNYGCSNWFMQTGGERDLNRAHAELMVNISDLYQHHQRGHLAAW